MNYRRFVIGSTTITALTLIIMTTTVAKSVITMRASSPLSFVSSFSTLTAPIRSYSRNRNPLASTSTLMETSACLMGPPMNRRWMVGSSSFRPPHSLSNPQQPTGRPFSSWRRKSKTQLSSTRPEDDSDFKNNTKNNNRGPSKQKKATSPSILSSSSSSSMIKFRPGDKIQVEVTNFGPLGASVDVIGLGHGDDVDLLQPDEPPYATGLILQKEIAYFRSARNGVDVVRGEILPGYVQSIREVDDEGAEEVEPTIKLDICLRSFGGKAKSQEVGEMILERLRSKVDGRLDVGEKSTPVEINREFPGVSKSVFKKSLGGLYKKGLVRPGPDSIELM